MHVITVHEEYAKTIQAAKQQRFESERNKLAGLDGALTSAAAKFLADELNESGFDVYCGHGVKGPFTGKIVSSLTENYKRGDELAHLDIAIVNQATYEVVALVEVEETTDKPKTLLSDLFGTLMGNFISLPNGRKPIVGAHTTLIILAKGRNHEDRNKQICQIAMKAKSALGTGNAEIGNIVIESFATFGKLKKVLMDKVEEAIRRNA